jgi:two-component system LytT family sensor kinase
VKHGLAPRRKAGRIEVAARRDDRVLELTVYDDGVGLGDPAGRRGVGLSNARARLSELYGGRASLELSPALDGGTIARVRIPWREAVEERERDLDQFGLQPLMPQEVHELEVILPCDIE